LVAVLAWLSIAAAYCPFIRVDRANRRAYLLLRSRANIVATRLDVVKQVYDDMTSTVADRHRLIAYREARSCVAAIERDLCFSESPWPLGTGYISLWQLLHRAEQALITIDTDDMVIAGALNDELRLEGSTIDNADALLEKLRVALTRFSAEAALYLERKPRTAPATQVDPGGAPVDCFSLPRCELARAVLREVRHNIESFRDERFEGLIRVRNHILVAVAFTGLFLYLIVGAALLVAPTAPTRRDRFLVAVVYYLIGALVGLFNRMRLEAEADKAVEDYGLSSARLVLTPLYSGLAAVAGVVLTVMLYNFADAYQSAVGSSASSTIRNFDDAFDVVRTPVGPIIAAVFGLAPSLLITSLQSQVTRYKSDLKSSASPEKGKA